MQRLQSIVTEHCTIWDRITLVVAFDSLYDNFEIITMPLLHSSNKNLKKIQLIVISIKATNMAKQAIVQIADLAIMAKKRMNSRQ